MHRAFWPVLIVGLGMSLLLSGILVQNPRTAFQVDGEHWYRIEQNGQHIGYMHNTTSEFVLTTRIDYHPPDAPSVVIHQRLHFAATAPSPLKRAAYSQRIGEQYSAVSLQPNHAEGSAVYAATIMRNNSVSQTQFKGSLTLADMYAVESWLHSQPELGSVFSAPYPDFEKLKVSRRAHRLLARDESGYDLVGAQMDSATQTRIDRNFVPTKLTMAGRYDVTLTTKHEAIPADPPDTIARRTTQKFGLNRALEERQKILELELLVIGNSSLPSAIVGRQGALSLDSKAAAPETYLAEHIDFPIQHPKIRRLLKRFATSGNDLADAQRLVGFTNSQLSYTEHEHAGTVLTALARRSGECTDFADIYTTLARSAGLPARTIYGLAYDTSGSPGFRFHAWNEVYAEGRWHSVDPTWNQITTDATHIPLSDDQYADLLNTGDDQLSFKVAGMRYQTATL